MRQAFSWPGLLLLAAVLSVAVSPVVAEEAGLRRFTISDGLPANTVTALAVDRRGFLWVGTVDGLARFDGSRFATFDERNGLPTTSITALLETPEGMLLVGTTRGLARLDDAADSEERLFIRVDADPIAPTSPNTAGARPDEAEPGADSPVGAHVHVFGLSLGPGSSVLVASPRGLYRLPAPSAGSVLRLEALSRIVPGPVTVGDCPFASTDREGNIWTMCDSLLSRIGPTGRVESWEVFRDLRIRTGTWILQMGQDADGRLLAAGSGFLGEVQVLEDGSARLRPWDCDGLLPNGWPRFHAFLRRRDGSLWAGTSVGPVAIDVARAGGACPASPLYPRGYQEQRSTVALVEDDGGNLWAAEGSRGLLKVPEHGFTWFADGLQPAWVDAMVESPRAELVFEGSPVGLHLLRDGRFTLLPLALPEAGIGWGSNQRLLFDRRGALWIATRSGLARWPAVADLARLEGRPPERTYTTRDGLPTDAVIRIFEDSRGDVWLGPDAGPGRPLCRWSRGSDSITCFGAAEGVLESQSLVRAYAEDQGGNVWIGFREGALLRWRDGELQSFGETEGFIASEVTAILADGTGSLWITVPDRGVYRVDAPQSDRPRFTLVGRAAGLSSTQLTCVVSDARGHVYFGSKRGIHRLDPDTGTIRDYTVQDGVLNPYVNTALVTRAGALWFGTSGGALRIVPRPDAAAPPPRVYIMGLRVAGVAHPVPPRGALTLDDLALDAAQRDLSIDFTGISNRPGERLRFQTRLAGAEESWSDPEERRSVAYARLAPGRYRFEVRAVNAEGVPSPETAAVGFDLPAPIWRRWWFLTLAVMAAGAIAVAFHRQRTARLLALMRQRTRIAMDLHDDIGSTLSQVALSSELELERLRNGRGDATRALERVAEATREALGAMSDVVWSLGPGHDTLSDLVRRVRSFALEAGANDGVAIRLALPATEEELALPANLRQPAYLVFKESLTNALRHARASAIDVSLAVRDGRLVLVVRDDGGGISGDGGEGSGGRGGHGLASMRERAERCGGTLSIETSPGGGTAVRFEAPLR